MTTFTTPSGSRTTLTASALNALASATYISCGVIDVKTAAPTDVVIEVEATPGTVSASKQLSVFVQASFDNSNFSSGPVSGVSTTDEPNLLLLGTLPLNSNSTLQRKPFSVLLALGYVPPYMRVVCKNETGAALAASGHGVYYTLYTGAGA
jgi:hypothetical protein